ncbi:unnamed protein product [Rhizophagus irregularis]|nr:unnamed protein product [Rhizophagus irregularis]
MSKSLTFKKIFTVGIKVRKDGLDPVLAHLKLNDNLSNIRQELEKNCLMNDALLFTKDTSEIQRRREREFLLDEIIEEIGDDKFINLKKNSNLGHDLKVLKDELQLEYGRKINSDELNRMSNITETSNIDIEWLKKSISDGRIKYIEPSAFKNIKQIGRGSFSDVFRANWRNISIALKSFNNEQTLKEIVKELEILQDVDSHENIIRFYGITKFETILEYADGGTLRTYLKEHFNKLNWDDKYQLASQLANAVEFIHECDIIHRDLHSNNILIHKKNIKLADFGRREDIIDGTTSAYSNLYQECWKYEPDERPNIQKVVLTLRSIISPEKNDTIIDNNNEEINNCEMGKLASKSCELTNFDDCSLSNASNLIDVSTSSISSRVDDKTYSSKLASTFESIISPDTIMDNNNEDINNNEMDKLASKSISIMSNEISFKDTDSLKN